MKIGDRVLTADGPGVIVDVEEYSRLKENRYGVKLDKWGPVKLKPVYYWEKELETIKP